MCAAISIAMYNRFTCAVVQFPSFFRKKKRKKRKKDGEQKKKRKRLALPRHLHWHAVLFPSFKQSCGFNGVWVDARKGDERGGEANHNLSTTYSTAPQKRKSDGGVDAGLLAYMVGTHSGRRAGGGSPSMGVVTFVRLVRGSHVLIHITA